MTLRRVVVVLGWLAFFLAALGLARWGLRQVAGVDGLYAGRALQTGMLQGADALSLTKSFADVLVKTSGNTKLAGDPRLASFAANLEKFVTGIDYRDRMEGIPIGDEQGTRERPFELTVHFDPAKVDTVLATLGEKPWTGVQPKIVVFLGVKNSARTYVLATDGEFGFDQRDALSAAAWQAGLPLLLPDNKALAVLDFEKITAAVPADLLAAAKTLGGDTALIGTLFWNDGARGWAAEWRLAKDGQLNSWSLHDVNFDTAFQSGMLGTLSILSGHGAPP